MRDRIGPTWLLGLAAFGVVAALLLLSPGDDGGNGDREQAYQIASRSGDWSLLGPSGAGGKGLSDLQGVRVGREAVIIAGATYDSTEVAAIGFDVKTGRPLPVARPPLDWRALHSVVLAAGQIVVWGGTSSMTNGIGEPGPRFEGARYIPADDVWRPVARGPLSGRFAHTAVGTPEGMLIWGGIATGGGASARFLDDGALYSPRDDRWRPVAASPLRARRNASAVWTGRRVLIWGGEISLAGGRRGDFPRDGASYDPERDSWKRIAKAPIRSTPTTQSFWTGSRMLTWTGQKALSYDPRSDRWSRLPEPPMQPREGSRAVWSDGELYVWGGVRGVCGACYLRSNQMNGAADSDGMAYDVRSRRWRLLPRSPLAPRDRHVVVEAPGGFLVWGGCCGGSRQRSSGALYRRDTSGRLSSGAYSRSRATSRASRKAWPAQAIRAVSSSISAGPAATSP